MLKNDVSINKVFKAGLILFTVFIVSCLFVSSLEVKADPVIGVVRDGENKDSSWAYNFGPKEYQAKHYSILLQVIDYEEDLYDNGFKEWTEYRLCLRSATGNQYHYTTKDKDFSIDDFFTAIVSDNGTALVNDDKVISIKYERPDLFSRF